MIIHTFSFQHFHWLFELIPIYPLYSFCHCFGCVTQGQLLSYALSQVPCLQSESEVKSLSPVQLFASPWTVACQVPPSMGFSRQEYWSGLPFPLPGDLPIPGTEPAFPESPELAGRFFTTWEACLYLYPCRNISINLIVKVKLLFQ